MHTEMPPTLALQQSQCLWQVGVGRFKPELITSTRPKAEARSLGPWPLHDTRSHKAAHDGQADTEILKYQEHLTEVAPPQTRTHI